MNYFTEALKQQLQSQIAGGNAVPMTGGLGSNPAIPLPAEQDTIPYVETTATGMVNSSTNPQEIADAVTTYNNGENVNPEDSYETLKPLEETLNPTVDPLTLDTSTSGAGIEMVPTSGQATEETPTEETPEQTTTFSSVTNNLYNAFTAGGQEGTEPHIGLDTQNITLPAGIVADGLVYNGQTINTGQNTIPASSFNPSLLDTSGAYKTIGTGSNAVTIRRSDYTSDQDFSRAVIAEFENRASTAAGTNWSNIPQSAQEALIKVGWNLGTGWFNSTSANVLYSELTKSTPDVNRINRSILRASTVSGGGASIGIAKARADAYNAARDAFNGAEITRIEADNSGTNTAFKYYDAAGNLVYTEQTNRAVGIYENGDNTRVEKNSAGEW